VISGHIKGSYPAVTLRLLCGYLVVEHIFGSSLDILNPWKFCWIKLSVSFRTHNGSGASNSEPV